MLYLLAADVFINQRISLNAGHLKQLFASVFLSHCHCVGFQIVNGIGHTTRQKPSIAASRYCCLLGNRLFLALALKMSKEPLRLATVTMSMLVSEIGWG
jgi:hypothetical protein